MCLISNKINKKSKLFFHYIFPSIIIFISFFSSYLIEILSYGIFNVFITNKKDSFLSKIASSSFMSKIIVGVINLICVIMIFPILIFYKVFSKKDNYHTKFITSVLYEIIFTVAQAFYAFGAVYHNGDNKDNVLLCVCVFCALCYLLT